MKPLAAPYPVPGYGTHTHSLCALEACWTRPTVSSPGGGQACLLSHPLKLANFGLFRSLREGLETTSRKTPVPTLIPKPLPSQPNQLTPDGSLGKRALYMP